MTTIDVATDFPTASPTGFASLLAPCRRIACLLLLAMLGLAPIVAAQDDGGGGDPPAAPAICHGASRLLPTFTSVPSFPNPEYPPNSKSFNAICLPEAWHLMQNHWQAPQVGIGPWPTLVVIDDGFFTTDDSGIWPPVFPGYPSGDASGHQPPPGTAPGFGFHGTTVLSLLASQVNNELLIAGVVGSWKHLPPGAVGPWGAGFLPVRVGNLTVPATPSMLADVFNDVVLTNPETRVVNLSKDLANISLPPGSYLEDQINMAGAWQIVVVTGAGNKRETRTAGDWIRQFENVIVVGALNNTGDDLWIESATEGTATGPGVDLYAPGQDLTVITRNRDLDVASGTSYATPLVSGVVAMMYNVDPFLYAAEVKSILVETADLVTIAAGAVPKLNAYRAVLCTSRLQRWSAAGTPDRFWACDAGLGGGWLKGHWKAY